MRRALDFILLGEYDDVLTVNAIMDILENISNQVDNRKKEGGYRQFAENLGEEWDERVDGLLYAFQLIPCIFPDKLIVEVVSHFKGVNPKVYQALKEILDFDWYHYLKKIKV